MPVEFRRVRSASCWCLLGALLWGGCVTPEDFEVRQVDLGNLQQVGSEETALSMDIAMYNPNRFDVRITGSALGLWLAGDSIGVLSFEPGTEMEGRTEANVRMRATLDSDRLSRLLSTRWFEFLIQGLPVRVDGWVAGRAWGVERTLDIHHEERIRVVG